MKIGFCILLCAGASLLTGCATIFPQQRPAMQQPKPQPQAIATTSVPSSAPARTMAGTSYRTAEQIRAPLSVDEKAVLASANTLLGRAPSSTVNVKGRTFVLDCIGTVSAIFYGVNIDVQKDFSRYGGNGVNRLYQSIKALNGLHKDLYPRPGDVIFWDNTWDANNDGNRTDDPRTHAGVVIAVDGDGTIHYVHEHIIKGVTVEAMNLLHPKDYYDPQGRIINNALAMNSGISRKDNPAHWTSGDLWNCFGDILRSKKHFAVADGLPDPNPPDEVLLAMRAPEPW
ncbi:MAG: CHAP domain-containing protein [Spirochaetia bacterium]|jgi:cell wall-associated NlpC family hydrolase